MLISLYVNFLTIQILKIRYDSFYWLQFSICQKYDDYQNKQKNKQKPTKQQQNPAWAALMGELNPNQRKL